MTAMRCDNIRATTHVVPAGPPKYIIPTLRGNNETPRHSFHHNQWPQSFRRDPPPHKNPPTHSPRPSDSPNWHAPSPNPPASFRSLSPPPQSLPAPLTCLFYPPGMPFTPPQSHTESQLTLKLIS